MGLKIMTKSKNRPTKWQFFHENHQLGKVVEMKRTGISFVPVQFSRTGIKRLKTWSGKCEGLGGGIDGLKNRSGKWEGPAEGDRRIKEPEWEMRRTGRGGLDGLKNRSGKCKGPGEGGSTG
jgi:hypothetical protein